MIGSGSAFTAASFNRWGITRKSKASKGVSLAVSVLISVGTFGEVIGLHLVPDADENSNVSTLRNISDYVELLATTCGVVTSIGSFVGGEGLKVAVAAGTCDTIFTLISVVGGELVPSLFLTARHISMIPLLISGAKASRTTVRVGANHDSRYCGSYQPKRRAQGMRMSEFIALLCLVIRDSILANHENFCLLILLYQ